MTGFFRWIRFIFRYLGNPPWDTGTSPPEVLEFIARHSTGKALDLGCGTGTNLLALSQAGWDAWGVDYVWSAVKKARTRMKNAGFHPHVQYGDVLNLKGFGKEFNLILDIGCFHGLSREKKRIYLQNLGRLLKKKGSFLIFAYLQKGNDDFGFLEEDFQELNNMFTLIWRKEGLGRRDRPCVWMQFDRTYAL